MRKFLFQCFTHRYLGWKINVHDTCDEQPAASEPEASIVPAPTDLEESPSIRSESRVKPNALIVEDQEDKNNTTVSEQPIVSPITNDPVLIHYMTPVFSTFTPYLFYTPYQQTFKPSPLLEPIGEDFTLKSVSSEAPKETTLPLSSTSTTTRATPTISEKIIVATTSDIKNQSYLVPPKLVYHNNFIMRRPTGPKRRPHFPVVRIKKPMYRPPIKMTLQRPPPLIDPLRFSESQIKLRRPTFVLTKPVTVKNVQISPQQASTERPSTTSSPLEKIKPVENYLNLKPAKNTGFHPESVVIEGGFKPIITKTIQKRIDEPEVMQLPKNFAPVFVPSPVDKIKRKQPYIKKFIVKHSRSVQDEEPVAAAAERVESYYLPPLGKPPQISARSQASNIDLEEPAKVDLGSPPDVVVTYDGKRVSGASLTAKIADRSSILDMRASKAAELIKARPQFVPFKGELPPLNPEIINKNVPQLQSRGVISRDLDAPRSSTKLSPIRHQREVEAPGLS